MRPSETSHSHANVSIPQHESRLVFTRLNRYLGRLSKGFEPEDVHRFRTNSRRIEALIGQLAPETKNKKKLLKLVSKLRKRAGKLRDVDVQIAYLKDLKIPDRQSHRAQLLESLAEEHVRRARKLAKAADPATLRELRKRLRREQNQIKLDGVDPLQLAVASLPRLNQVPLTERTLHACRIAAKQARYLAELAGETPEAKEFVSQLKRVQDAIGEWHDTVRLKEKAGERFGSASESALVSMLQNISRARFRNASNALVAALAAVSELHRPRKPAMKTEHNAVAFASVGKRAAVA
jgi:CHAD domain-containing protein